MAVATAVLLSSCDTVLKPAFADQGYATYYTVQSCKDEGNTGITASGEIYRESQYTCALPNRKLFGKKFKVRSVKTGKTVRVRCNDFGPGRGSRRRGTIIDLTPLAFSALGHPLSDGRIRVSVEEIN